MSNYIHRVLLYKKLPQSLAAGNNNDGGSGIHVWLRCLWLRAGVLIKLSTGLRSHLKALPKAVQSHGYQPTSVPPHLGLATEQPMTWLPASHRASNPKELKRQEKKSMSKMEVRAFL